MSANHIDTVKDTGGCATGADSRKEINKSINGFSVVIRFPSAGNKQALTVAKELMINSYAERLFCKKI